jgi:hypothetical protein
VALTWVLGTVATLGYLTGVAHPPQLDPLVWSALWTCSVLSTLVLVLWLRRSNVTVRERSELGLRGGLATLLTAPVYAAAVTRAAVRHPLGYHVTRKGGAASPDVLRTFRTHLVWFVAIATALGVDTVPGNYSSAAPRMWAVGRSARVRDSGRSALRVAHPPSGSDRVRLWKSRVPCTPW